MFSKNGQVVIQRKFLKTTRITNKKTHFYVIRPAAEEFYDMISRKN